MLRRRLLAVLLGLSLAAGALWLCDRWLWGTLRDKEVWLWD